jgi:hypothetical protein
VQIIMLGEKIMRFKFTKVLFVFAAAMWMTATALAQGGQLVAAEWGIPGQRVDVTPQVRTLVREGIIQFEVTRQNLGVDPAPGRVKDLVIRIRHWDGDVQEYRYPEHAVVNLEIDPDRPFEWHERGLHIMRAYYGGEGHFINVTERLRDLTRDGRLYTRVDNEHLGVDPDPHVHKVLRVLYWFDGERRQIVVPEHAEFHLP